MSKRIPIFLGLLLICVAIWALIAPSEYQLIERLDNIGYDVQLRTRTLTQHTAHIAPVAIIDIDDVSIKALGRWPWPRSLLAQLTQKLEASGAAVIAWDIFFSEKEPNIADSVLDKLNKTKIVNSTVSSFLTKNDELFDNDILFAKTLALNSNILALGFLPRKEEHNSLPKPLLTLSDKELNELNIIRAAGYISNISILQDKAKGSGFINIFADNDGIIRRAALLIEYKNGLYPALALAAVLAFLDEDIKLITPSYGDTKKLEGIQIGPVTIPTDEKGQVLIPFIGKSFSFPYYSALDVLNNKLPPDTLRGKILFIGTSATGLGDLQATAIENPFPGVEIQATLVNGILQNNFSYKPEWTYGANVFITALLGLIAAILFPYLGPRMLGILIILLPPTLLFINNWIWIRTGLILSFLMPVLLLLAIAICNIIYGYLFETRKREQLKEMFGQYVPEKHIDEMLRTTSDYGLHGEDREMTVLFADIRNFTSISEGMTAADLVDMLNTFFTPMTEIIFKHSGTIDKYIGDLIMAFWGAPLKDKHHRRHALQSALEMQAKVKALHPVLAEHHWPQIKIGIGINSGEMSVGDMGSRFRRNYTVLGDAVNLGSRVEGLTKFYGVDIIATENVIAHQTKFVFRKLDLVRVKGKQTAIAIYELICTTAELTTELANELDHYHHGLEFYLAQRWNDAEMIMEELHRRFPDKVLYNLYLQRIKEFKNHPLPADWDGVYVHVTK